MRLALVAFWVCSTFANAASVSHELLEGAAACQEIRIPKWTRPQGLPSDRFYEGNCQYDFRSPDGVSIYLGLSCFGNVAIRIPERYRLSPLHSSNAELISHEAWDRADVLFATPSLPGPAPTRLLRQNPRDEAGRPYQWMKSVSPGRFRVAIDRYSGIFFYPEWIWQGRRHIEGEYRTEISDSASGTLLIQIQGKFHDVHPLQFLEAGGWITSRYFFLPLSMRSSLFCDVDKAAAAKGTVVQSPPVRGLRGPTKEIQEQTPRVRVLKVADTPVVDQASGRILG